MLRAQQPCVEAPGTLTVLAGSAARLPIEEVARAFESQHPGVTVARSYGGSGALLSQISVGETGDVFIPASEDYMDRAEAKRLIIPDTRKTVCYLVPVLAVQKGNPKNIKSVQDLVRSDVKLGIATPKAVVLGDVATELFKKAGIRPNIVTHAESGGALETLLKLKRIDATIGWATMAHSSPNDIEVLPLPEDMVSRRTMPAAVIKFTAHRKLSEQFVEFLASSDVSREAFRRYGFAVD